MTFIDILLISLSLSMDAFAVSICTGLEMDKFTWRKALVVGLYFGIFQAVMPLIGYLIGSQFAELIEAFDHWIAFALLFLIGGKMIRDSLRKNEGESQTESCGELSLGPKRMLPLALATSIDALAIGITFAFLQVQVFSSIVLIGAVTLVISMTGVKIGNAFGSKFRNKAELFGGIVLMLIGLKILLEHLEVFG